MPQQSFIPETDGSSTHLDARNVINSNANDAETRLTALESGGGGGGQVDSVVAGDDVSVDNTDPANPVVNSTSTLDSVTTNGATTTNDIEVGGIKIPTGAVDTYVLTSDANGFGTWQAAGPSGTTLSGTTTGTTPTEIFVDGVANNRMTIVGGTTWIFSAYIVATDEDADGDKAGYKIEGVITNIGGVNSNTSLVGNSVKTVLSEDNPSWDATVVADDTNNALTFVVTGSSTVHWSATVTKTEVAATNLLPI